MDHTQDINFEEFFSQLTSEERIKAFAMLSTTDVLFVNEAQLAPSIPQRRELAALCRQYDYQHKMLENELVSCQKHEVQDLTLRMAKAAGIVEILNYLIRLTPTQQESDPS